VVYFILPDGEAFASVRERVKQRKRKRGGRVDIPAPEISGLVWLALILLLMYGTYDVFIFFVRRRGGSWSWTVH